MEDGNYFKTIGSEICRDLNLTRIRVYPNLKRTMETKSGCITHPIFPRNLSVR